MDDATGVRAVARIGGQLRVPQDDGEPLELVVVADRQHEVTVGCRKRVVWRDRRVTVSRPDGRIPRSERARRLIAEQRRYRVEHRNIDALADPGPAARKQGGEDALDRE